MTIHADEASRAILLHLKVPKRDFEEAVMQIAAIIDLHWSPLPSDKLRGLVRSLQEIRTAMRGGFTSRAHLLMMEISESYTDAELEALLSQEPSSGAKPVAYAISLDGKVVDVYLHKGSAEGEIRIRNEIDAPELLGRRALIPLFASPVTGGKK